MQSKPKKKPVLTLPIGQPYRAKKKSTPKKLYICVDDDGYSHKPQSTVEAAFKDHGEDDSRVEDCVFYEVKEVQVVSGVRLAKK